MHITFVSTFVPRKCGIATYTKDLALAMQEKKHTVAIVAMENPSIPTSYAPPVIGILPQQKKKPM